MKIIVFSGTGDGRELCRELAAHGYDVHVYVATEYGAGCTDGMSVHTGRLGAEEMENEIRGCGGVIDATHPYAAEATRNIKAACEKCGVRYFRLARNETVCHGAVYVKSAAEAARYLSDKSGDVFVSTGSKTLAEFECIGDRVRARVLDTPQVREKCASTAVREILYKTPPFAYEDNMADFKGCRYLVTKDGGTAGGMEEKLRAARALGMETVIIGRPEEGRYGMSAQELSDMFCRVRIGSRESALAVKQSRIVTEKILDAVPGMETELVAMKTTGDRILDKTLDKIGGKGLFVKELDRALLRHECDISVHSLKDMPMETAPGLKLAAYTERAAANDVLILPKGVTELNRLLPIGCSSQRRAVQLKALYPDARIKPVRGNVLTRLKKLDSGEYSALVLARAGIERLGLTDRISREFTPEEILPAAGQGIIAVETRRDCDYVWLDAVNDKRSELCAAAERAFVRALDGGCSAPVAAYAVIDDDTMTLTGMDARSGKVKKETVRGAACDAARLGEMLAERIIG